MQSPETQKIAAATFALYYHTEWRARRLPPPASLPSALRPQAFEGAISTLTGEPDEADRDDVALRLGAISLSISQLARAYRPGGIPDRFGLDYRGAAERLLPIWQRLSKRDFKGREASEHSDLERLLRLLFDTPIRSAEQRFIEAFRALYQPAQWKVRRFSLSWSYCNRVSDVCVSIETSKRLSQFDRLLNPHDWHVNVPIVWDRSDAVDLAPIDLGNPPSGVNQARNPFPLFFEGANFGVTPIDIASYQNFLKMDISVGQDRPANLNSVPPPSPPCGVAAGDPYEFRYRQSSCQRSKLFGAFQPHGGIDVDEGFGRCEPLADNFTRVTARKRARFDQPPGILNVLYNDVAALYLKWLIELFVLFAAVI